MTTRDPILDALDELESRAYALSKAAAHARGAREDGDVLQAIGILAGAKRDAEQVARLYAGVCAVLEVARQ